MKSYINVGMFGMGHVGTALFRLLKENRSLIDNRIGMPIRISKVVVSDLSKNRGVDVSGLNMGTDPDLILEDPEIDVVVELIGGVTLAESIIRRALDKGKSVVTANKALLAEKGAVIFPAAYRNQGYFGFEASVGAAIPIIRTFREGYAGDEILAFSAILNGTSNYILTHMTENGTEFDEALGQAREKGLAEADPTLDIEGIDAAHKLTILLNLAFGGRFDFSSLYMEGISKITAADISFTKQLGYRIKHLGIARKSEYGVEARVHPVLLPQQHILSSVNGSFNAVSLTCKYSGSSLLYGHGAGPDPSASGVAADLIEACRSIIAKQQPRTSPVNVPLKSWLPMEIVSMDELQSEYYLRFKVMDHPGVLASISKILADHSISIRSAIQPGTSAEGKMVDIVLMTHQALESQIQSALQAIQPLDFMAAESQLIRIGG